MGMFPGVRIPIVDGPDGTHDYKRNHKRKQGGYQNLSPHILFSLL
jgi:hypothetical protein